MKLDRLLPADDDDNERMDSVSFESGRTKSKKHLWFVLTFVLVGMVLAIGTFFAVSPATQEDDSHAIKSPADTNKYRVIKLDTGLTAMLISDPKTDSSAAAIDYGAGSFFDIFGDKNEGTAGLAHFHEHMLFLGSKQFPGEDQFNTMLTMYNGQDNAYTAEEHTNFHFQCQNAGFHSVLNIWAAFFKEPLFTASSMYREMNQVHSEYTKDVPQEGWREWTMIKQTGKKGHPFQKFDIGTIETLNITNIHKYLVDWHNKFFSSKIATMAIYSNETLDTQEAWVKNIFKDVANHDLDYPLVDAHPYPESQLQKKYWVKPLDESSAIDILWEIPVTYFKYRVPALEWIFSMIDFKGPGGLSDKLIQRNLATAVGADEATVARTFGIVLVSVKLTENGLDHVQEIVNYVLQYIQLILEKGLKDDWRFTDYTDLDKFAWKYYTRPDGSLYSYVSDISSNMHFKEAQDMLYPQFSCPPERYQWDKDLIKSVLEAMTADKLILIQFTKQHNFTDHETEHYFHIPYQVEDIPSDTINTWQNTNISPDLKLPPKNTWTIQDTSLFPETNITNPTVVYRTPESKFRGWYGYNTEKKVPKVLVSFIFRNTIIRSTARSFTIAKMFKKLIIYHFALEFSQAVEVGYGVGIELGSDGLGFTFSGYHDHMIRLIEEFFKLVLSKEKMGVSDVIFESQKTDLKNALDSDNRGPSYSQTRGTFFHVTMDNAWPLEEQATALQSITLVDVMQFIETLQGQVQVEFYVYGNADEQYAREIGQKVEAIISTDVVTYDIKHREVPIGINLIQTENQNPEDKNSASDVYIQISSDDVLKNVVLLDTLVPFLKEKAFDRLRTKQTLGYIVSAGGASFGFVLYARVIVVGPKHDATLLLTKIIEFLQVFYDEHIKDMTDERFKELMRPTKKSYTTTDLSIAQRQELVMAQIGSTNYDFDHRSKLDSTANNVTTSDLKEFYSTYFLGEARRILTVQLFAQGINQTLPTIDHNLLEGESAFSNQPMFRHNIDMQKV